MKDGKISGDLTILPLIGGSDYRRMISTVGEVKLKNTSGDPHPEALLHWITALDMDSPELKRASNFAALMAPRSAPVHSVGSANPIPSILTAHPFSENSAKPLQKAVKMGPRTSWRKLGTHSSSP